MFGKYFGIDDVVQQLVGGFLLSGPFVVTEEVWKLGASMGVFHFIGALLIIVIIGYAGLFRAEGREEEKEKSLFGVPLRFISLLIISFASVSIMAFLFTAPTVFSATVWATIKALSIAGIFSMIGALTADSLL